MTPHAVTIRINGKPHHAAAGSSAAAAILNAGYTMRASVTGEPRAALCGMGVCLECRVIINGVPHARSCQIECADGMEIETA